MFGHSEKISSFIDASDSAGNTVEYKLINESQVKLSFNDTMKEVVAFLKSGSLKTIETPFEGTCIQITNDGTKVVFSCKAQEFNVAGRILAKEARLVVVDLVLEQVVLDRKISEEDILSLKISSDDMFVFAGGSDYLIYQFLLSDLSLVSKYPGHTSSITSISLSQSSTSLFSSSLDGTLRYFSFSTPPQPPSILFTYQSSLTCLDLSSTEHYLSAGASSSLLIFKLKQTQNPSLKQIQSIPHNSIITSCKFSTSCSFITSGCQSGSVQVFSLTSFNLLHSFQMTDHISDLAISRNDEVLIAGSKNTDIKIWFLKLNEEINYDGHSGWVKQCMFIENDSKILSISDDKKIRIWKIPHFETENSVLEEINGEVLKIWVSREGEGVKGVVKVVGETFVFVWDEFGTVLNQFFIAGIDASAFWVVQEQDLVCVALWKEKDMIGDFSVFDLGFGKKVREMEVLEQVKMIYVSDFGGVLVLVENFRFSVWKFASLEIVQVVYFSKQEILAVCCDRNDENLFVAGQKHLYFYKVFWFLSSVKEINHKVYPEYFCSAQLFIPNDSPFIYIITSGFLEIIQYDSLIPVLRLNESYLGGFSNINNTVFLYSVYSILILDSETFQILSRIRKTFEIKCLILSNDKKKLFASNKSKILKFENPMSPNKLSLVGDYSYIESFQGYIDKLLLGNCNQIYSESLWIIEPAHVNLLHLFAYLNMDDLIRDAFQVNYDKIPFFKSKDEFSPLSIALKMRFYETAHELIKGLIKNFRKSDPSNYLPALRFQVIQNDLIDLNHFDYETLHKLYQVIYTKDTSSYLPNFSPSTLKLPLLNITQNFFISSTEFPLKHYEDLSLVDPIYLKKL